MNYENLLFAFAEGVATVTVHRPNKLNALNRATLTELHSVFADIASNADIAAVILTGSGEKAFVAGADITEINSLTAVEAHRYSLLGQTLMSAIENLGKPVIAAVNGYALGGGCELAMACTLRLAADSARFGLPEIGLGIMPGFGGTQRLSRLVGRGVALELALMGSQIDAERARDLGLVNRIVGGEELLSQADTLARRLATAAPIAMRNILDAVNRGSDAGLERGLEYESQLFALCCSTDDMREGTRAFLDKRKPAFQGR